MLRGGEKGGNITTKLGGDGRHYRWLTGRDFLTERESRGKRRVGLAWSFSILKKMGRSEFDFARP